MKVLGIGNALVDVLVKLPSDDVLAKLSLAKGSMQLIDDTQRNGLIVETAALPQKVTAGGSASNTVAALARIGMTAGFIGKTGQDHYAQLYLQDMQKMNVNTHLISKQAPSGISMVMMSPDGERTFATYLGVAAELSAQDLSEDIFRKYDCLYIEGYLVQDPELIETAMKTAKKLGMKIVIDTASYNVVETNRDLFWKLITGYADIVFANEEEAKALTGQESPEDAVRTIAKETDIAVVKTGSKGSLIVRGDELVSAHAVETKVADTTAAGDYYAAGFLYALAKNQSLQKCAATGALTAARIISVIGTRLNDEAWNNLLPEINKITSGK
jgi:sugar/nucleoside kinase (ribokinase family)